MARGPFQGTFQPNARPTVATAPDAIVYINGEGDVVGCPQCAKRFDLNKYITAIQTDLSVDSCPGSANVSMSIPRHSIDDFYFDGNPIITPMMEVEIYAKGYYLVEGLPQYYPIFWGLVTEVSESYSSGEHTVSLHCADILKWWELCKLNINAAFAAPSGQQGRGVTGNVFTQVNPYDMIFTLASQSFGDIVNATGSMNALLREGTQKDVFNSTMTDITLYWEKRFAKMRNNLVLYGAAGVAVRGDTLWQEYSKQPTPTVTGSMASTAVRNANGGPDAGQMSYDPASDKVAAYKIVYQNIGVGIWQSEYRTKLEIANDAKDAIGFEFYMDVTGDIVFKPPFYNLDVLGNKPTSWIQDIDIIDWDFSDSESEVVTQITMQGNYGGTQDPGIPHEATPFTSVTDFHLLRKYGWRTHPYNSEFMSDPTQMFFHGLDMLDRINSKRHRGSVTIPMRPELRLGFPIYLAPKDQLWYVTGISHSFAFGGRCTTSLQLTSRRSKFVPPRGIADLTLTSPVDPPAPSKDGAPKAARFTSKQLSEKGVFELKMGNALEMPANQALFEGKSGAENPAEPLILRHPKTGRIVGYPNIVLAYTRPFATSDIHKYAGQRDAQLANPQVSKQLREITRQRQEVYDFKLTDRFTVNRNAVLQGKHLSNTYQYGLNSAGVYVYAHDAGKVIKQLLMVHTENLHVTPAPDPATVDKAAANPMSMIRPVSDERGFELIGHFQYGRGVSLRDGRLIVNSQDKATVGVQLAVAADLSGMLTVQSQGLTSIATGYADPAATLATMTPEEGQTAAVMVGSESSPNTKAPEFVGVDDEGVGTATLGSQEQRGIEPSVEATQLSRALTLAEMAVQDAAGRQQDGDCVCLTGRADLAFMSLDYQVKVLTGDAAEDSSTLPANSPLVDRGGPIQTGATAALVSEVARLEAEKADVDARIKELEQQQRESRSDEAVTQMLNEAWDLWGKLQTKTTEMQFELENQRAKYSGSSNSIFTKTNSEVVNKVEDFLLKLYSTLDDAHQLFESAIRGDKLPMQDAADLVPRPTPKRHVSPNAASTSPPSELAPPFSAPNRFMLGDASAAVGSAESNVNNLSKAWSDFSKDLRGDSAKRNLSTQISQDKASIARLTATRDQLIKQRDTNATVIGVDLQKQIDTLSQEIAKTQKQLLDNQTKLATL
jgi:hypothetical protein